MPLSLSKPGTFNYEGILADLAPAKEVTIATFGVDTADEALITRLRERPAGSKLTIISSVPGRFSEYYPGNAGNTARLNARKRIAKIVRALAPDKFNCRVEIWFCFENHAKIILCDQRAAYVGSANFTSASRGNYEGGYLTKDSDEIREITAYLDTLRQTSVPYHQIEGSAELVSLFEFAAAIPDLVEEFEWQVNDWHMSYGDEFTPSFNFAKFGMPTGVEQAVAKGLASAKRLEDKCRAEEARPEEESFVEASLFSDFEELHDLMEQIRDQTVRREQRDSSELLSDFIEQGPGDPDEIQASEEFQEELEDEEAEIESQAKKQTSEFVSQMKKIRSAIFGALVNHPDVDNTV